MKQCCECLHFLNILQSTYKQKTKSMGLLERIYNDIKCSLYDPTIILIRSHCITVLYKLKDLYLSKSWNLVSLSITDGRFNFA